MLLGIAAGVLYVFGVLFAMGWVVDQSFGRAIACVAAALLAVLLSGLGPTLVAKVNRPPQG